MCNCFSLILTLDHIVHFPLHFPNMHLSSTNTFSMHMWTKPCMYFFYSTKQDLTRICIMFWHARSFIFSLLLTLCLFHSLSFTHVYVDKHRHTQHNTDTHNADTHLQTLCLNTHHSRVAGASRSQPSSQLSSSDEVTWACCSSLNLYACSSLHTMPLNYCSLRVCKWGGNSQVKGVGKGERGGNSSSIAGCHSYGQNNAFLFFKKYTLTLTAKKITWLEWNQII